MVSKLEKIASLLVSTLNPGGFISERTLRSTARTLWLNSIPQGKIAETSGKGALGVPHSIPALV